MITRHCPKRRIFWVVFEDRMTLNSHWFHWFLSPGFFHCWVFYGAKAGTVALHPLRNTWGLEWMPCEPHEFAQQLYEHPEQRYRILVIDRSTRFAYTIRGVITCVSVVKACLNLRGWAITPKQLYKHLIKLGAIEVGET